MESTPTTSPLTSRKESLLNRFALYTFAALAFLAAVAATQSARADLFVASGNTDQVLRYDGATGAFENVFASGGGLDTSTFLAFTPVPEPVSMVLLGLGGAGMLLP